MSRSLLAGLAGLAGLAVVAAAGLAGAWFLLAEPRPAPAAPAWPATKVALATAERVTVPRRFQGVGEVEAIRQVLVAAETSGRITGIDVTSGEAVKAGTLLVQLNDAVERAELQQQLAQLRNAEARLARLKRLVERNAASREQLDDAQAERDVTAAAVARTRALIDQKAIRAPFDGVAGIRRVHPGQYLETGAPVVSLVDTSLLRINFALDEQAMPELSLGQRVEVSADAWPDQVFVAEITAIDPLIGDARMVRIQATLPEPDGRLKAGMFAGVRVVRPSGPPALVVPETAITYTAYGDSLFVTRADPARGLVATRVAVEVGARWDGRAEIVSGLADGDRVVTSGQVRLVDGMAVEPVAHDTLEVRP
ncbi:efflux RND transporter periplasmic adaptor subunit [Tistrella mobilis]|uniref:RND efflux membrane fusion protein n=1 Tax=Tistrella mobilis (strain KA081020-065) TaxID=1110502 RepID=I3TRG9_TISMK|nr:efflux RND transporter periplasmic adaptor subunit [Tistrella mobilis]AFK55357.1 RND efflux membrane fusion protein precursor [Tistrella mobilis KA081020-065]